MTRTGRAMLALGVVALMSLLLALMGASWPRFNPPAASAPPTTDLARAPAPPTQTPTAQPLPTATMARRAFLDSTSPKVAPTTFLPGKGPELPGELVFSGRRLDFYVGKNTFTADQVAELGARSELALSYVQRRFAVQLSRRVSVGVYTKGLAPSRGTRGIAHTREDFVRIFYQPGEDMQKALVIISHELGHQLQAEAYGNDAQSRADIVLLEGLATWISGEYWLHMVDAPSWQARSRELVRAGYGANLAAVGNIDSDTAYELWAGFVDYLATTYGWDKFNALYVSGCGRAPGSADYQGIYGKSFSELAREWRATLK